MASVRRLERRIEALERGAPLEGQAALAAADRAVVLIYTAGHPMPQPPAGARVAVWIPDNQRDPQKGSSHGRQDQQ